MPPRKVRKRTTTEVKKPKKVLKKSENIHTIENNENVSDNECLKSLQGNVPRLTIEVFSWKGEVIPHQKYSHRQESDDETTKSESLEMKNRKHAEELKLQKHELDQLKDITHVQSSSDFEKLVLQSPNSSVVWIAYMTYHVELGELEKARLVAERAINTISFREEQEKINVWMAYLNMETIYGDPTDVKKLLHRAVSCNNPLDINLKMCNIYVANGKTFEVEELFTFLCHDLKHEKLVWKSYAHFLFKSGQVDIARSVLHHALLDLDKRDHVEVIIKFATLEFSHGDIERGCTIFENLIASYSGRTDLWSVYVDMMVKSGDIAGARHLLERAVKQKFNAKKLSFLLQKFKRFEETHGTEEQVEKVKELASSVLN
ncbi:protein RRP5 [Biomphalaria glabrata]|nr:protein RRP5 [Biomphalaria glabrata]